MQNNVPFFNSTFLTDDERQFINSFWGYFFNQDFSEHIFLFLAVEKRSSNPRKLFDLLKVCYLVLERQGKIKDQVVYDQIMQVTKERKDNGKKINFSELLQLIPFESQVRSEIVGYKSTYSVNDLCKHFDKSRTVIYDYFKRGLVYYEDASGFRRVKGEDLKKFEDENYTYNVNGRKQIKDKRREKYPSFV